MANKMEVKKAVSRTTKKTIKTNAVKAPAKVNLKSDVLIGKSSDFSFKKALKDALRQVKNHPDYFKYEVIKIEYEKGGIADISNLLVTIKRVEL
jgi:hypothetical protein